MEFGINRGSLSRGSIFTIIFVALIFYLSILSPTSHDGILPNTNLIITQWLVLSVFIVFTMIYYAKVDKKLLVISVFTLLYMIIITIMSINYDFHAEFSIARLAPIICFLAISILIVNITISIKWVFIFIHLFMFIFIIWNSLIISDNAWIRQFTINNYSQLYEAATSNMFIKKRPVMSFGIYTFATYFYFLFFLIIRKLYKKTNSKIFLIYLYLLLIGTLLLSSNTTAVFSVIMYIYILLAKKQSTYKFTVLCIGLLGLYYVFTNETLISYYLESFNSENNGVAGRYTQAGSLNANSIYIQDNFFIGFNIIRHTKLTYTDSGYMVNYLMGGVPLNIAIYYSLYRFMKNNFQKDWFLIFIPLMIFELALPYSIYYKSMYFMLFFTIIYKSIEVSLKTKGQ